MIKPHFVRKGCAGRVQIAILPQFLAIEPHFYQNAFEMQRFSKLQLSDCQRERPTGQRDNGTGTTGTRQRERDNGTGSTEPILGYWWIFWIPTVSTSLPTPQKHQGTIAPGRFRHSLKSAMVVVMPTENMRSPNLQHRVRSDSTCQFFGDEQV